MSCAWIWPSCEPGLLNWFQSMVAKLFRIEFIFVDRVFTCWPTWIIVFNELNACWIEFKSLWLNPFCCSVCIKLVHWFTLDGKLFRLSPPVCCCNWLSRFVSWLRSIDWPCTPLLLATMLITTSTTDATRFWIIFIFMNRIYVIFLLLRIFVYEWVLVIFYRFFFARSISGLFFSPFEKNELQSLSLLWVFVYGIFLLFELFYFSLSLPLSLEMFLSYKFCVSLFHFGFSCFVIIVVVVNFLFLENKKSYYTSYC